MANRGAALSRIFGGAASLLLFVSSPAVARTWQVTIENMQFQPAELSVKAGDTVVWTNKDIVPHTVTKAGKSPSVDSGAIPADKTFRTKLKKAGTFSYACAFHPTMKGEIKVEVQGR